MLIVDFGYEPRRPELPNPLYWEGFDDNISEHAPVGSVGLGQGGVRFAREDRCWWSCVEVYVGVDGDEWLSVWRSNACSKAGSIPG